MGEIRTARFVDALALADRLRPEDVREIASTWGLGSREGLFHCLLHSDRSYALLEAGEVEALWGVSGVTDGGLAIGIPWMLAGERLFDRERGTLAQSRRIVEHLLMDHDLLANRTHAANEAHLRWLRWCGFHELRRSRVSAESAFVEFYRLNPHRAPAPAVARTVLLRRAPPGSGRLDAAVPVRRLVTLAVRLLDGRQPVEAAALQELGELLPAIDAIVVAPSRQSRGCLALMLELAARLDGRLQPRHGAAAELIGALARVAETLALDGVVEAAEAVQMLQLARQRRAVGSGAGRSGFGEGKVDGRESGAPGVAALRWLLRGYLQTLTLQGRYPRSCGFRVWCAALGAPRAPSRPLGLDPRRLAELLRDRRVAEGLLAGDGAGPPARQQALLDRPVDAAGLIARVRECAGGGGVLAAALLAQLDAPAVPGAAAAPCLRECADVRHAIAAVSAIADGVALALLPGLRVSGVISGYGDRHWLYRLLRAQLLEACGIAGGELQGLLRDEVAGLLLAGWVERRLLSPPVAAVFEPEAVLAEDLLDRWGPATLARADLPRVLGLIGPPLAVPGLSALQLAPALLVWHLAMTGALGATVAAVAEVFEDRGPPSRARWRKFLQSLTRDVTMVTFERHTHPDAAHDEHQHATSFRNDPSPHGGGAAAGPPAAADASRRGRGTASQHRRWRP